MPEADLACPECGTPMRLMGGMWGIRYYCTAGGCRGSHGAHPDGTPVGTPANSGTRKARAAAHSDFDRVWRHGIMSRGQAYAWLAGALGAPGPVHIGEMDAEGCARVSAAVRARFPELFPFDP